MPSDQFKLIRINLEQKLLGVSSRVVVISSARRGEGKTYVAERLAEEFASQTPHIRSEINEIRSQVLLVRANFRDNKSAPSVPGVMEWAKFCLKQGSFEEEAQRYLSRLIIPVQNSYHILAAGNMHMPLSTFFSQNLLKKIFKSLTRRFHTILIDTDSLERGTDALAFSPVASGLVSVVQAGKTTEREVKKLLHWSELSGLKNIGTVLNVIPSFKRSYVFV